MSTNKIEKITYERKVINVEDLLTDFENWSDDSAGKILLSLNLSVL